MTTTRGGHVWSVDVFGVICHFLYVDGSLALLGKAKRSKRAVREGIVGTLGTRKLLALLFTKRSNRIKWYGVMVGG